jgi:uncharacterized protein YkwD
MAQPITEFTMFMKRFFALGVIVSLLAACQGSPAATTPPVPVETQVAATLTSIAQANTATPQPTVAPTNTVPPPATETPAVPATPAPPTATPETPVPTNDPNCTNLATFVDDVTIPDNSTVVAGQSFIKTWRVRNLGTCVWGPTYSLAYYSEDAMGAPASVPLGVAFPNQTLDISVPLTASTKAGPQRGNFVLENPAGLIMKIDQDSRLWVIINVAAGGAANPTSAPAQNPTSAPAQGGASGGPGYANVSCAFTLDAAKVADTIAAINAYRAQKGLGAYTVNARLSEAALAHAKDMACNQLFYHDGTNGSTPRTRVAASGYAASAVTENVYGSYPPLTGQGAVNWWINDKSDLTHNANLISTQYKEIGVGYAFFNNYGYYVVDFAAP